MSSAIKLIRGDARFGNRTVRASEVFASESPATAPAPVAERELDVVVKSLDRDEGRVEITGGDGRTRERYLSIESLRAVGAARPGGRAKLHVVVRPDGRYEMELRRASSRVGAPDAVAVTAAVADEEPPESFLLARPDAPRIA